MALFKGDRIEVGMQRRIAKQKTKSSQKEVPLLIESERKEGYEVRTDTFQTEQACRAKSRK